MSYYHICPLCGAALDPGEKCDCQQCDRTDLSTDEYKPTWPRAALRAYEEEAQCREDSPY